MSTFAVILPAAGKSSRFKGQQKKPYANLDGRAVWLHSAEKFLNRDEVKEVILVIAPGDEETFQMKFGANVAVLGIKVVKGGAERADSVEKALAQVDTSVGFVCVHDAARPCLAETWIDKVFAEAKKSGGAILAVPVSGTIKRVEKHAITETVSREGLWEAQTPQVFRREWILDAYAKRGDFAATDDAQLVERAGHPVAVVQGSPINIKITTSEDLRLAQQAIKALPKPKSKGPIHPFADDDMWR